MANKKKKNKQPTHQGHQKTAPQSVPTKQQVQENAPQYKLWMTASIVAFAVAFVTMLYSGRLEYGSVVYNNSQWLVYSSVACGGVLLAYASKFNHTKSKLNVQVVGLVMIILGAGRLVSMLFFS